jgi:hypothetical protein
MPDGHIHSLDFRLPENLHQGRELDVAANQQSTSEKCAVTPARKNPIAIYRSIFGIFKSAAQKLVNGRRERRLEFSVNDPEAHNGGASGVEIDFQFWGLSRLGRGLLRHGGAREEAREAKPCQLLARRTVSQKATFPT